MIDFIRVCHQRVKRRIKLKEAKRRASCETDAGLGEGPVNNFLIGYEFSGSVGL